MGSNALDEYYNAWQKVKSCNNILYDVQSFLSRTLHQSHQQDKFSKPMPWIGMYIALASLICVLAMAADLVHGFRNRKLWFPCKYFTLNAVSLTVIAVTIKLPMDLNNIMPIAAKLGSMAFTCTMMANLLPSLATMDRKELLTNIIALVVLVITLVMNICIQANTGVFLYTEDYYSIEKPVFYYRPAVTTGDLSFVAIIYVVVLLMLLIIHICSSLAILKSKQILELKYQEVHETNSKDRQPGRLTVERLKEQVSNYWIMAETGSPQFMTACSATTSAAGIICALSMAVNNLFLLIIARSQGDNSDNSDYKWSMYVILIIQYIGVIIGTIAPLFRCFADLSFKLSIKWIWNHIKVFKVESYWTQKLSDWKQSNIPFSVSSRKSKIVLRNIKIIVLSFCIGFQKTVVVACKMIAVVPNFFVICVLCCWKMINAIFRALGVVLVKIPEQLEDNRDRRRYVLQLQDDKEVADRALKGITKSVNRLIQKAEKKQPTKLMKLLEKSSSFEEVGKYDSDHVSSLLSEEYPDCWSLTVVTLTTIAISLSNTQDSILDSVSEGLAYVTLVEENLNATDEYVIIQKASKMLWLEVEVHEWLGKKLKNTPPRANTAGQILEWFRDTSEHVITEVKAEVEAEVEGIDIDGRKENSFCRSICANSMYRITQTILHSYQDTVDEVTHDDLFVKLSSMIADILAACLTNLPQVIAMKCHTSVIEKREASVHAAAQLLGETTQIINNLQDRELPSLNPDELPFIDKWHDYFKHPFC